MPAISSSNDDGAAALQLLPGELFIETNRAGVQAASGLPGADGNAEAGSSDGKFISAAAFKGAQRTVRSSIEALSESRSDQVGTCGAGWNADTSQCQQTEVDQLREH